MTRNQIKWTATLADGEATHVYTDASATQAEARAKLALLMQSNRESLILDTSPSRDPMALEGERASVAARDFLTMIESIRKETT